jgi:hypothetical protein
MWNVHEETQREKLRTLFNTRIYVNVAVLVTLINIVICCDELEEIRGVIGDHDPS